MSRASYESSFGVGGDRISQFFDPSAGVRVQVLENVGAGYRICVNRY